MAGVVNRDDVREFLATRRARITPQDVGLPTHGANRRVPGLRREEVAVLAGVSIDYYTRFERGNLTGVSDSVLEAVARALLLDEAERAHLLDLARTANNTSTTRRRRPSEHQVRPGMQRLLDAMTAAPTLVRNGRLDVIATNPLGRALLSPAFADPATPTNLARFTFLDPTAREFFVDWDDVANATVAILRTEAGRDPADRNLTDLIGELATRSDEFRTRWAAHNVRLHDHGTKRFHHPVVGDLALTFEELPLPADPGLTMTAYTAEPGSASHDALALLASWAATPDPRPDPSQPTIATSISSSSGTKRHMAPPEGRGNGVTAVSEGGGPRQTRAARSWSLRRATRGIVQSCVPATRASSRCSTDGTSPGGSPPHAPTVRCGRAGRRSPRWRRACCPTTTRQQAARHPAVWTVEDGAIVGRQDAAGSGWGGYLVSEGTYSDFELIVEANPDWPADTGVYLRKQARTFHGIQVLVDHRQSGSIAGSYGNGVGGFHAVPFAIDARYDANGTPSGWGRTTRPRPWSGSATQSGHAQRRGEPGGVPRRVAVAGLKRAPCPHRRDTAGRHDLGQRVEGSRARHGDPHGPELRRRRRRRSDPNAGTSRSRSTTMTPSSANDAGAATWPAGGATSASRSSDDCRPP